MKLLLLILSIVVFVVTAILCLTGGAWETFLHVTALISVGFALFAASFLPIP